MTARCCQPDGGGGPAHLALLYSSDAEYLAGVSDFLSPALGAREPIVLAVPEPRAALVTQHLGEAAASIEILDIHELGRNPARIIPLMLTLLERHQGRRVHHIGEPVWPGRSPEEIQEALRHEALINLAWPESSLRVLCPYDAGRLDASIIRDVQSTHPWLMRAGAVTRNPDFGGSDFPGGSDDPLPRPPADAAAMTFGLADLGTVRSLVAQHGERAGLARAKCEDLVIAVNEVASNAIKHGRSEGRLHVWSTARELICQLEDRGHISDRMAGRYRPAVGTNGGLGLWMVNQLCDLVQTRTTPSGTTIRLRARVGAAER